MADRCQRVAARTGAALALALSTAAGANGSFGLPFDSVAGAGMAFAGLDAVTDDIGAAARNPALHGLASDHGLTFGGHLAFYSTRFSGVANREGTNGEAIGGGQGGNPGRLDIPLPDIVYTRALSDRLAVGVSLIAPYGITLRFDPDWVGRYHATDTVIRGVELVPAVAWQATSWLRVGGGVRLHVFDAEFSNDVDIGAVVQQRVEAEAGADITSPACAVAGEPDLPGKYDIFNRLNASEFAVAAQFGARVQITPAIAFGVDWRAPISHRLAGPASRQRRGWTVDEFANDPCLTGVRVGLAAMGRSFEEEVVDVVRAASSNTEFNTNLTLPDTTSASLTWTGGRLTLAASGRWTRWSRLQQATIAFDNATPTVTEPLGFDDSILIAAGARYRLTDALDVSAGYARESSTVDDTTRSARAPDSRRNYITAGMTWQITPVWGVALSTGVLRGKQATVRDTTEASGSGNVLAGRFTPLTLVFGGARIEYTF